MKRRPWDAGSVSVSHTLLVAALAAVACVPDAVRWDTEQRAPAVMRTDARLSFSAAGSPVFIEPWVPRTVPIRTSMCAASLVAVRARGDTAFAAWWEPRSDSSALLVAARSDDGGWVWREPVVVDTTDQGRTGCMRTSPFVAADSVSGYVHLVYFLVAPEGPGVFLTHSMEGGTMFHQPVPVVYGERSSAAAVASHGDMVAVAYEDPNASVSQVRLALSHSTGHIFERRTTVSSANVTAIRPAVVLRSDRVVVSWLERPRKGGPVTMVVRTGTVHW